MPDRRAMVAGFPARWRVVLPFAVLSLVAVALGCSVAQLSGVAPGSWALNLAAWTLGAAVAALLATAAGEGWGRGFLIAAPVGLMMTLLSPGLSGVHRWTSLGSMRLNVAEVLLPPAVVALAALGPGRRWPWLAAVAVMGLLVAQPDASQATAFGGALILIVALRLRGRGVRWGLSAFSVLAIVAAWARPDPLAPVPEVEDILRLAWAICPAVAIVGSVVLVGAALTPLLAGREEGRAWAAVPLALAVYFLLVVLAPTLGAFPVPLIGMGTSPILGFWLGVGLVAAWASGRLSDTPTP